MRKVDAGTDWTPAINNGAAVEAMGVFRELAALGPQDPHSVGQTEMLSLLQAGRSLQCHMVAAVYPHLDNADESSVPGLVDYAAVPRGTGDPAPLIGAWTQAVPVHIDDERKRAAYDFLMWITDAEVQRRYAEAGGIVTNQQVYDSDLTQQYDFRGGEFGALNRILEAVGLGTQNWLASYPLALPALMLVDVWHWTPIVFIVVFAAFHGVDRSLFEAARVDGASELRLVWHTSEAMT